MQSLVVQYGRFVMDAVICGLSFAHIPDHQENLTI